MTQYEKFVLGEWTVYPMEGRLFSGEDNIHIQPKSMDVLLCLAKNSPGVVGRDELLREVWGERAQSDEPLTRCIGELRRALGDARDDPAYIATIPKRGYQLLKEPVGLALNESAGPRLTAAQAASRTSTLKKIAAGAGILVLAAFIEVGIERAIDGSNSSESTEETPAADLYSVAVLPFVNLSSDEDQEYFSDGMSEELINLLSKIPELSVTSRSSAFSFKGKQIDIPTIARALNVRHVLEGSVRRSGDQVRITAQLIDPASDTHLWSETYERTVGDVFTTQDEIAAKVVDKLKLTFHENATNDRETDPAAYSLYLQANFFSTKVTVDDITHSNDLYRQALAIDPEYDAAWSGLATNYNNLATNGHIPVDSGFEMAREAAETALSIDPNNIGASGQLGWIAMWHDNDLAAAAEHYQHALSKDSADPGIIGNAAILLKGLGRLGQAIALMEVQASRDPVNPTAHYNLAVGYLAAGRWEESIASQNTVLQLSPSYFASHSFIGTALLMTGDKQAALAAMQEEPSEPYRLLGLVMAYHAMGEQELSNSTLTELIGKYEQGWAYNIAYALAFRNDADAAFEWLHKAVEYNDPGLADIVAEILFSHLHLDPRWGRFLESIDKAPEQLRIINFDFNVPK